MDVILDLDWCQLREMSVKLTCLHGTRARCQYPQKRKPSKPKFGHEESQFSPPPKFLQR